ncbi:MAG: sigma-70 family RNA polymerase sigma factor [Phycisphaerales bacterium]|nr:sigma-70 family RNA polymerase sigma factor [Phycisphaerales bacterium]
MTQVTQILQAIETGDTTATDRLLPIVYDELREIAARQMAFERPGHSLQATALVHEAYMKLIGTEEVRWSGRAHFFGAAAESMRRILVDSARRRNRSKRGGGARRRLSLDVADLAMDEQASQILALDEALTRLDSQDPRMASIVKLRFFSGLSVDETAKALDTSARTIKREWALARAWLFRALRDEDEI